MDNYRSINYEREYRRELEGLKKSNFRKKNRNLIIRYKNHKLANSVRLASYKRDEIPKAVLQVWN